MTGISAAILELKAFQERLARQITSLCAIDRALEQCDRSHGDVFGPLSPAQAAGFVTEGLTPGSGAGSQGAPPEAPVRATAPKKTPTPAKAVTPAKTPTGRAATNLATVVAKVLTALRSRPAHTWNQLQVASAARVDRQRVSPALHALIRQGLVVATGATNGRRYALTAAGDSRSQRTPQPPSGELETVWSGAKERSS
jgi:hypothetical protein